MPDFNQYDFKRAGINFFQVFLIGYATVVLLLFTWSATSDYGLEKTLNDFSIDLVASPLFWLGPFLLALIVGVGRGVKYEEFDVSDPEAWDKHLEKERWRNQPYWFKTTCVVLVLVLLYLVISPESELSIEGVEHMREIAVKIHNLTLYHKLDEALADGKVMQSEFRDFMNASMKAELEAFAAANDTD